MKELSDGAPVTQGSGVSRRTLMGAMAAAAALPLIATRAQARQGPRAPGATLLPRSGHTATALQNGAVLIVGGFLGSALADVQILTTDGVFAGAPLITPRYDHSAVLLPDGRVLVAGGRYLGPLADVEIYDPVADAWSPATPLSYPRYQHSAAYAQGAVILTGGISQGAVADAEFYVP